MDNFSNPKPLGHLTKFYVDCKRANDKFVTYLTCENRFNTQGTVGKDFPWVTLLKVIALVQDSINFFYDMPRNH